MCRPNEASTDRSCRAGLVALFQLFKGGFLLGVCRTFAHTLFLQQRLPLSFALRIQQKLGWQLINIDFAEDRASGSSLFRRRALSFFRERLFSLSFVFFPVQNFGRLGNSAFRISVRALATLTASFSKSASLFLWAKAEASFARLDMTAVFK